MPSVLLGLFLIFVARPLAVSLCLLPFRLPRAETAFVSWVGLRGAVSILLALTPLIGGLEKAATIFNIAFIIVLVSLVIQGWTVGPLARRLGLIVPARLGPLDKVELELPGSAHHELLAYTVVPGSPVARGQRIPRWARPSLVVRDGRSMRFQDMGRLWPATMSTSSCPTAIRACSTGCSPAAPRSIPRTRTSSAPSPSIRRGSASDLEAAYGAGPDRSGARA